MTRKISFIVVQFLICTLSLPAQQSEEYPQWVNDKVSQMSLKEKVGQLLIYTLPSKSNVRYKKTLEQVIKEYNIGGIMYSSGNIVDQIALTNSLKKSSSAVPLLFSIDNELGMPAYLTGAPDFPIRGTLEYIVDQQLIDAYHKEINREYELMGIHTDVVPEGMVVTSAISLDDTRNKILNSVKIGDITEQEINERCKKVLAKKSQLGINNPRKAIATKKLAETIITKESLELASELRKAAITVLGNYAPVIPLSKEGIAVLCIGDEEDDQIFLTSLEKYASAKVFRLSYETDENTRKQVLNELRNYKRVIVNITADMLDVRIQRRFLSQLDISAPLIYISFSPYKTMQMLLEPLQKSSVIILAHSNNDEVQRHVADLLFAEATANGKLPVDMGRQFVRGDGITIYKGMQGGIVPEDYGMKSSVLYKNIDLLLEEAIEDQTFPGCQVLIIKDGQPVYDKCFGIHSDKNQTPVRSTDMYDLSELTMTTGTLLGIMKLYDEGKIKLEDKISDYLAAFRKTDKQDITIKDLLLHESGLLPYIRFYQQIIDDKTVRGPFFQGFVDDWHHTRSGENTYACSDFNFEKGIMSEQETSKHTLHMAENMWLDSNFKNTMIQAIAKSDFDGKRYIYSNLGFLLLQQIIEQVAGTSLNIYLDREFYTPMGLSHTMFLPLRHYGKEDIMPTVDNDYLRRQDLHGYVHDETAACMGGIAGNAGLFSTSTDVAQIYLMLLNGGEYGGKRYLSETTCRLFTTEKSTVSRRGLGFDKPDMKNPLASLCSRSTPAESYGEVGFTGTSAWVDPVNNIVYVFLSNRICPNAWNLKIVDSKVREKVQEVIYDSMK